VQRKHVVHRPDRDQVLAIVEDPATDSDALRALERVVY
jgi:hypothetical protein